MNLLITPEPTILSEYNFTPASINSFSNWPPVRRENNFTLYSNEFNRGSILRR